MSTVLTSDMHAWARGLAQRIGRRVPPLAATRRRRLLLVHLDGVPKQLLDEAVHTRRMPFFSRLVRSGAYRLEEAFWGSPASTPCFQAGLLYGIEHPNLPAYSWFDREMGRQVRMNTPQDASDIEQRLGRTRCPRLFAEGGHTYFSLFRGGAGNRVCMSTLSSLGVLGRALSSEMEGLLAASTVSPGRYLRLLGRDSWHALCEAWCWGRALRDFRHEGGFLLSRVLLQRLGWSFAHTKALVDMVRGVPILYLVFGNYDEVAHRRGPRSELALAELERVDGYLAELYAMARTVERPYDLIFLTDHGHVESLPFEQRQGWRLEDMLLRGPSATLPESVRRGLLDGRVPGPAGASGPPEVPMVIESGNFAHVYLTRRRQPLEARELLADHRDVLARASLHPDIGMVALRRGDSAVALVKGEVYGAGEMERAPLAEEFSRRAVANYLHELPFMPTAGDLVLFGEAVRPGATVGFAWEFGSHGGLTRTETCSTVCWPGEGPVDLSGLTHCVNLHQRLSEAYLA
ncbi:Type I phosphodiesterase/nucleotide pyrophosphatase family protein [Stigmatella aurantiaca DW4/3-1]|uniref:Type I phosphodiesterase/nucleotide pyrophosphatase family protein n=1 Tax=Stigmatella aurantiaca (strain DW4/3-1) TaxID=378806 RepID=E3FXG9_STIAD|nr:alkaline phosphatase family protein [Stigmatella aurantiaca]ADO73582.1 Type I phosphodiesterase/nucleotide pyrophosphatase family protein [Stigmatella aurantiaca DW4/3-1]